MESVAGRGACLETSEHEVLQRDGVSGSWQVGKPGLEGRHGHPGRRGQDRIWARMWNRASQDAAATL